MKLKRIKYTKMKYTKTNKEVFDKVDRGYTELNIDEKDIKNVFYILL